MIMISENIRFYRKTNNMSQDELAEKLGVSRQSISFWENGQTQPTLENVIALAEIFNISSDALLSQSSASAGQSSASADQSSAPAGANTEKAPNKNIPDGHHGKKKALWLIIAIAAVIIIGIVLFVVFYNSSTASGNPAATVSPTAAVSSTAAVSPATTVPKDVPDFDLFSFCKDFAIKKGRLNGDYCIYQQPATRYGGYKDEYFSISYWGDSNKVEFSLHCPLSETLSINFYLSMRGGYDGKYEYASSKYYRENGESLRFASGIIDPAVFSAEYPLSCDTYEGSFEGQDQFMEESRVGMCDLIRCLKGFVEAENMECGFAAFDFVNF